MKVGTFDNYQAMARETAVYPNIGQNLSYPTLGLCGEAGEVAEKVKKLLRDKDGMSDNVFIYEMKRELGDVLWYISNICSELGITLASVAAHNLEKLKKREEENKLHGSGDNR